YKIFQGISTRSFVDELAEHFALVKLSKPPASRQESSELYVVCLDFMEQTGSSSLINRTSV
ncbi:MAG: SAM-dependent methyltransferase, partial [Nitrososphaeraceae archaeon]